MPDYHHNIHHRKSIRLKEYDYSEAGWYFITTCVQNRTCLFGEIRVGTPQMILNAAGEMIAKWYYKLENKYPGIRCREMVDWFKTMTTNEYIRGVNIQG